MTLLSPQTMVLTQGCPGGGAVEERLAHAAPGAAVAGRRVLVVALLGGIQPAVAAVGVAHAGAARGGTEKAAFQRTGGRAAVAGRDVAVVAALAAVDHAVAAAGGRHRRAGLARRCCRRSPPSTWHAAEQPSRADGVAVVAGFVGGDLAVAADHLVHAGLADGRAGVVGLDRADARAAIAGSGVAVVADLAGFFDRVATERPGIRWRWGRVGIVHRHVGRRRLRPPAAADRSRRRPDHWRCQPRHRRWASRRAVAPDSAAPHTPAPPRPTNTRLEGHAQTSDASRAPADDK